MNDASEDSPLEEAIEEAKEKTAKVLELLNEPNLPIIVNEDEDGKVDDAGSGRAS